jgi:hypothetical protein
VVSLETFGYSLICKDLLFLNFTKNQEACILCDETWYVATLTHLPPVSKLAATGRLTASANSNNALNSLKQKVTDVSTPML